MTNFLGRVIRRLEVDRAVAFTILTQGWSVLAGPLALFAVAHSMSAEQQGFYYTFGGVLALQVFVELGLATVVTQTASHEWALLKLDENDRISGDERAYGRLCSLAHLTLRWYIICAVLVVLAVGAGGYAFFSLKPNPGFPWSAAWLSLCVVTGSGLAATPVIAIIEGCNQVASTTQLRFWQACLSTITLLIALFAGGGLFALPAAAIARVAAAAIFLFFNRWRFVRQLFQRQGSDPILWRQEIWPFQWRIAVSWIAGYFIYSLFTPVIFYYCGPKIAGQWGMTWTLVVLVESLSYSWLSTRTPRFGMLIARREFRELDVMFARLLRIALGVGFVCSGGVVALVLFLRAAGLPLAERLLPLGLVIILLIQRVINVAIVALAYYLRAHKQEPMMIPSVGTALLVGTCTWIATPRFGAAGAAIGFLAVTVIWTLPSCYYVFQRARREWHQPLVPANTTA